MFHRLATDNNRFCRDFSVAKKTEIGCKIGFDIALQKCVRELSKFSVLSQNRANDFCMSKFVRFFQFYGHAHRIDPNL